jgi:hypothetical protein
VSPLLVAGYVFSITATVLAWAIVAQRPEHRPVALLLSLGLAADLAQRVLVSAVLNVPGPYAGGARLAFHVQEAAFIVGKSLFTFRAQDPVGILRAAIREAPRLARRRGPAPRARPPAGPRQLRPRVTCGHQLAEGPALAWARASSATTPRRDAHASR